MRLRQSASAVEVWEGIARFVNSRKAPIHVVLLPGDIVLRNAIRIKRTPKKAKLKKTASSDTL